MVTHRDRRQLESYARVLFIGDADQLPPVIEEGVSEAEYGSAGVLDKPDARLETVHRQDTESSVLSVANAVRQGRQPEYGVSPDGHVFCLSEADGHFGVDQLDELVDRAGAAQLVACRGQRVRALEARAHAASHGFRTQGGRDPGGE
jgi:ATP-dependent exoDNAse (exonuclease V) alpha subunit